MLMDNHCIFCRSGEMSGQNTKESVIVGNKEGRDASNFCHISDESV